MIFTDRAPTTRPEDRRPNPYSVWARPFCNESPPGLRPAFSLLRAPDRRHGDYRRTEPHLGAVARLIRIAGTAVGSHRLLLRLRTKSREHIDWSCTHLDPGTSSSNWKCEGLTTHKYIYVSPRSLQIV